MFLPMPDHLKIHNWCLKAIGEEVYIMQTHKTQSKLLKSLINFPHTHTLFNMNNVCVWE
jgi:hypothetical protein